MLCTVVIHKSAYLKICYIICAGAILGKPWIFHDSLLGPSGDFPWWFFRIFSPRSSLIHFARIGLAPLNCVVRRQKACGVNNRGGATQCRQNGSNLYNSAPLIVWFDSQLFSSSTMSDISVLGKIARGFGTWYFPRKRKVYVLHFFSILVIGKEIFLTKEEFDLKSQFLTNNCKKVYYIYTISLYHFCQ